MPDWMPHHIAGSIEPNGTFALETDLGHIRVHPGNAVITNARWSDFWGTRPDHVSAGT
jgi:hypothetical protein